MQKPTNPMHDVLIVGEAPGFVEELVGVPFVGPAGKLLAGLLKSIGIKKHLVSITNVIQCVPTNDGKTVRKPTQREIDCCIEHLVEEIDELKPSLVIALGEVAFSTLTGRKMSMKDARGDYHHLALQTKWKCKVFATYHPASALRMRDRIPIIERDLEKAFFEKHKTTIEVESFPKMKWKKARNGMELFEFATSCSEFAFDTETTGLDPFNDKIIGLAIANERGAMFVDFSLIDATLMQALRDVFKDESIRKIAQNSQFDVDFLERQGIFIQGLAFDTQLAQQLIEPDLPKDLQYMRTQYTKIPPYKPTKAEMKHASKIANLAEICSYDAITTLEVARKQRTLLTQKQTRLMNELLLPLIPCLIHMRRMGVRVDKQGIISIYKNLLPQIESMKDEFNKLGINPFSPNQVSQFFGLKDAQELTIVRAIKNGHVHSDLLEKLLELKKMSKLTSTYLKSFFNKCDKNGFIHTNFHLEGTGTGRLSSSNPNLQNVPPAIRIVITADDEDHVLVSFDFKQLELRVGAVLANEHELLNVLRNGGDPHEETRRAIFGPEEKPGQRTIAKGVVFGTMYGRTARSIAIELGIPVVEAERIQQLCIKRWPGFKEYISKIEKEFYSKRELTTPFGRKRRMLDIKQAYNFPIQSSASDVNLFGLLGLFKAGLDVRLTIHDENVVHCKAKDWMDVVELGKQILERPFAELMNEKFPVEAKVGFRWGKMTRAK